MDLRYAAACNVFTHRWAKKSVTSYTSVNKYNLNLCLAHFNALWMEHIHSFRTGIMVEYLVMSTSQGTYGRIEQTSYVIRDIYEICRAGGGVGGARGLGLGNAGLDPEYKMTTFFQMYFQEKNIILYSGQYGSWRIPFMVVLLKLPVKPMTCAHGKFLFQNCSNIYFWNHYKSVTFCCSLVWHP